MAAEIQNECCDFAQSPVLTLDDKLENGKKLIIDAENDYTNIKLATSFIEKCLVPDPVSMNEAKNFIKYQMSAVYHFVGKTGDRIVQDMIKSFVESRKQYIRKVEQDARKSAFDIDPKYKGMYSIEVTKYRIIVHPHLDEIADMVTENMHIIPYRDCLYVDVGGYHKNDIKAVKSAATEIISGITKLKNSKGITANVKDAMTLMYRNSAKEYPFKNLSRVLNVKNGVLVFDDNGNISLEEHDPDKYKFDYMFPIEYDPSADSTNIMSAIVKYSDKWDGIIQILAQTCLQKMGYAPFKTGWLLYGPPDYAKTTVLDIFRMFVDEESVSAVALSRMSSEDKFSLAPMEGKTMNIADELNYFKMTDTNTYKNITGSYKIWVEPKHIDAYAAYSTAVHVFATNNPPSFDSRVKDDEAFWKRWVLIPCTKTKFKRDEKYATNHILTPENMSGLLNEVLKIVTAYIKGTELKYNSSRGDEWEDTREEWLRAGSPLYKFITENMVKGGETVILKDELLTCVQEWCDTHLLYKKIRPETTNALNEIVLMCNGTIDERRNFLKFSAAELSEKVNGKHKVSFSEGLTSEESRCFVLPWTWKETSPYKGKFRVPSRPKRG